MHPGRLATEIEIFLLASHEWVAVSEICRQFGITERMLRADGSRRPLLEKFAESSTHNGRNGFKHIAHTTVAERLEYKHNRLKRLVAERRAISAYNHALENCLTGDPRQERHSGQTILPL